jgi:hypothetical protein
VDRIAATVALMLLTAVSIAAAVLATHSRSRERLDDLVRRSPVAQAIARHSNKGDPVLFLATSVATAYPIMTQLDRRPASRYLAIFAIPLLYHGVTASADAPFPYRQAGAQVLNEERRLQAELRLDILESHPKLILVDGHRTCDWCPAGFGMHDYLTRTGFVADAMSGYRNAGTVGEFVMYLPNDDQTP